MNTAPIIVTVYDRVEHFRQCIGALGLNPLAKESDLFVISDAAKQPSHAEAVRHVREFAADISGFRKVNLVLRPENWGSFRSTLEGIQRVLADHDRFIFLEDDVIVSTNFLAYMNDGLEFFADDPRFFSVCAFQFPFRLPRQLEGDVYLMPCGNSWGFAMWRRRFEEIDLEPKNRYQEVLQNPELKARMASIGRYLLSVLKHDSEGKLQALDVRMAYHHVARRMFSVFPRVSKSINIGFDGQGEHCGVVKDKQNLPTLDRSGNRMVFPLNLEIDPRVVRAYRRYQDANLAERMVRIVRTVGAIELLRHARRRTVSLLRTKQTSRGNLRKGTRR